MRVLCHLLLLALVHVASSTEEEEEEKKSQLCFTTGGTAPFGSACSCAATRQPEG